jgi:DNA-binding SARP family transcriptional activator
MNFIQTLRAVLIFALVPLVACCSASGFDFEKDFTRANDTYHGSDQLAAKNALETFIADAERNESSARKTKGLNFDRVLAMAWLQLNSVYEASGEQAKADQALSKAMQYFDRDEGIASDPKYKSDKRGALREFLTHTEGYQTPEWKRSPSSKR